MPRSKRAPQVDWGRHPIELLEPRFLLSTTWTVTSAADDGTAGTLRSAIANSAAGDLIQFDPTVFAPGSPQTITLVSGQLEIAHNLTIQGPGAATLAISGNNASTIFQVDAGSQLAVSGLALTKGSGKTAGNAGGILALGSLNVSNCVFSSDSAASNGGAILATSGAQTSNTITVTVNGCTFSNNSAGATGGAVYMLGGNLNVSTSTFASNTASQGGGAIDAEGSFNSLSVSSSTFASNTAALGRGGAILAGVAQLGVVNSTFTGGSARQGGAIDCGGATTIITNCTIAGNAATGANGGGIFLPQPLSGITAQISNTIVANNTHSVTGVVSPNEIDPIAGWV
ncbi:MAG TPA: hypothetical protein VN541_10600, partial [Tepidisphaeraceae bacterium]|nr:hypothetical protein [Tepidisphaeraceae bacterium]